MQPFAIDSFGKAFDSSSMPTTGKWLISRGGGTEPRWRGDGKELFWLSEGKLMSVLVTTIGSNFQVDGPRPLFDVPPLALPLPFPSYRYAVTADGKRFLVLIDPRDAAQPPLTVIGALAYYAETVTPISTDSPVPCVRVFTNSTTEQPYQSVRQVFDGAVVRAGITTGDVTLHTLRHTALSRMIAAGSTITP